MGRRGPHCEFHSIVPQLLLLFLLSCCSCGMCHRRHSESHKDDLHGSAIRTTAIQWDTLSDPMRLSPTLEKKTIHDETSGIVRSLTTSNPFGLLVQHLHSIFTLFVHNHPSWRIMNGWSPGKWVSTPDEDETHSCPFHISLIYSPLLLLLLMGNEKKCAIWVRETPRCLLYAFLTLSANLPRKRVSHPPLLAYLALPTTHRIPDSHHPRTLFTAYYCRWTVISGRNVLTIRGTSSILNRYTPQIRLSPIEPSLLFHALSRCVYMQSETNRAEIFHSLHDNCFQFNR